MSYNNESYGEEDDTNYEYLFLTKNEMSRPDYRCVFDGFEMNVNGGYALTDKGKRIPKCLKYFNTSTVVGAKIKNAVDGGFYYDNNQVAYKVGSAFEQTLFKVKLGCNNESATLYYDNPQQYNRHQNNQRGKWDNDYNDSSSSQWEDRQNKFVENPRTAKNIIIR